MRKFSNVVVGILAAIVCALITYITRDSSRQNFIFNLAFLAVMMLIMLVSYFAGFFRLTQTRVGLDRATRKLKAIASNGGTMASITSPGSTPFEVRFLDAHYQDYLTYLHKTNSPTDIGDYLGEFEINSYTHRRMLEMVVSACSQIRGSSSQLTSAMSPGMDSLRLAASDTTRSATRSHAAKSPPGLGRDSSQSPTGPRS